MDMVNRLIQIAKGISQSLGETCEAVVHDRDHRIAYIANGHISGREQGQEMEESVFKYFEDETRANNGTVVRLTRKNNGELHKSTTMMFFDETGAYEAMLCFTVNLTALDQAKKMLDSLMNVMPFDSPEAIGSDLTIADYSKLVIAVGPGLQRGQAADPAQAGGEGRVPAEGLGAPGLRAAGHFTGHPVQLSAGDPHPGQRLPSALPEIRKILQQVHRSSRESAQWHSPLRR